MIGIVFIGNLKYCPYLSKYLDVINEYDVEYEVLYWNRDKGIEEYPENYMYFDLKSRLEKNKLSKAMDFIRFQRWLISKLKSQKYDKLIILSTLTGILLKDVLTKEYSGRYIYDIRDYSYEKLKIFKDIQEEVIKNSYFTCISSKGFISFLPKNYNYVISHNFSYSDVNNISKFTPKQKGSSLNIVWTGVIRYSEHQSKIIERLKNDKRFCLFYHGTGPGSERLMNYCKIRGIDNVYFTGYYNNSERPSLLNKADILNNSYGDERNYNKIGYLISNRLYDGLLYKIPQLVELNSYKSKLVVSRRIGIGLDVNSNSFADDLYDYYFSIEPGEFDRCCDRLMKEILLEDKIYTDQIREFIKEV